LKNEINALISSVESLTRKGINDFDSFTEYIENEINSNSYDRYMDESILEKRTGSSTYAGTLPEPSEIDPLQKVFLAIISLPREDREAFVANVLVNLTPDNYADYVYEARKSWA